MTVKMANKLLVVSAVNLVEGGTYKVLVDCLFSASETLGPEWRIIALVHDKSLIAIPRVECVEFPLAKGSWARRMVLEWLGWKSMSLRLNADIWLSMHDLTPTVFAKRRVVYCHNPSPFFKVTLKEAWLEPKFLLFTIFYKYIYAFNIRKNDFVVVQQDWIREYFIKWFGCPSVIVSHPSIERAIAIEDYMAPLGKFTLIYPALPRVFKNMDILCDAIALLEPIYTDRVELLLTIDGTENRYSRYLYKRYKNVPGIRFIGLQDRDSIGGLYQRCHAVMFPSRLETWGLPITEAKTYGKFLYVADLPYAHETVGNYQHVRFLNPLVAGEWAQSIRDLIDGAPKFDGNKSLLPGDPFSKDWPSMWKLLTDGL